MTCELVVLPKAQADIENIVRYLAQALASPQAARNFLDELQKQLDLVCEQPRMHPLSRLPRVAALGYRTIRVKRYLALYTYRDNRVILAHVFHQSQDYARYV